jgi:hypothetical protein
MLRRLSFLAAGSVVFLVAACATAWAQDIFVTPIPSAPFSGTIEVLRTVVQPDGRVMNLKTTRMIARDSQGRIRNETRAMEPLTEMAAPQLVRVHLYDPQTRATTMLDVQQQTYWTGTVNRPPATEPPGLQYASPGGATLPLSQFAREEDLGTHEMDGLMVHGVRETQTIPADANGGGKPVVVTDEYWYSDDLRINMEIKHHDPRTGSVMLKVTQVSQQEPDPALFQIPDGYKAEGMGR